MKSSSPASTATGLPQNVLLRNHRELRAQLLATPAFVKNPAFAPIAERHAMALATATAAAAAVRATPETIGDPPEPNPERAARVSALVDAEEEVAAATEVLNGTPHAIVNPARTPIVDAAFAAAIALVEAAANPKTPPSAGEPAPRTEA
jgi:hypothetical protein